MENYRRLARLHVRPLIGAQKVGALDADMLDSFYAELRRCRDHCDRRPHVRHRTSVPHHCDSRCGPHECRPLAPSSIRQIHFMLSGALKRGMLWRWIAANPISQAQPPAAPKPNPQPPTPDEAARILNAAWSDPDWEVLIWLAMVSGCRRGELCALRWPHLDIDAGVLTLARNRRQRGGRTWEKTLRRTRPGASPSTPTRWPCSPSTASAARTARRRSTSRCVPTPSCSPATSRARAPSCRTRSASDTQSLSPV